MWCVAAITVSSLVVVVVNLWLIFLLFSTLSINAWYSRYILHRTPALFVHKVVLRGASFNCLFVPVDRLSRRVSDGRFPDCRFRSISTPARRGAVRRGAVRRVEPSSQRRVDSASVAVGSA